MGVAAAVMIYGASAFAADKNFGTGTVTFRGTITEGSCDISADGAPTTVEFGQISSGKLRPGVPDDSSAQIFSFHLKNCEFPKSTEESHLNEVTLNKVTIGFSGVSVDSKNNYFKDSVSGVTNIGVQITDFNKKIVKAKVGQPDFSGVVDGDMYELNAGMDNILQYIAKLVNTGTDSDKVSPGNFNIPVTYYLHYK